MLAAAKSAETARAEVAETERDELQGQLDEATEQGVADRERIAELEQVCGRMTTKAEENAKKVADLEEGLKNAVMENRQLFEALTQCEQMLRMIGQEPPPRKIGVPPGGGRGRRRSVM